MKWLERKDRSFDSCDDQNIDMPQMKAFAYRVAML